MARKIPAPDRSSAPEEGADDLSILHPDVTLPIGGRTIVVQEYRFVAGLMVRAKAIPLTKALQVQIESGDGLVEDILDVLAGNSVLVRELILDAITGADDLQVRMDLSRWIDQLDDADGELLLLTWWGVCGHFFMRQIARRLRQKLVRQIDLAQQKLDGATSMPASLRADTETPDTSAPDTPLAS